MVTALELTLQPLHLAFSSTNTNIQTSNITTINTITTNHNNPSIKAHIVRARITSRLTLHPRHPHLTAMRSPGMGPMLPMEWPALRA